MMPSANWESYEALEKLHSKKAIFGHLWCRLICAHRSAETLGGLNSPQKFHGLAKTKGCGKWVLVLALTSCGMSAKIWPVMCYSVGLE